MPHTTTQNEHTMGHELTQGLPRDYSLYFLIRSRTGSKACSWVWPWVANWL